MGFPPDPPNQAGPPRGVARRPTPEAPADLTPRSDGDRFIAAFSYFFASAPLFAVVVLVLNRAPGYRRYHAQQALAFALAILVIELGVGLFLGFGEGSLAALAALPFEFWYGYTAYAADGPFVIPLVTPLARRLFPGFPSDEELRPGG